MSRYAIRGGIAGRERLRLLARVMWPSTSQVLLRAGVAEGMTCLDAGCGGGDVSLELARMVGSGGRVVGIDLDEVKVRLARDEAAQHGVRNVEFRVGDVSAIEDDERFDVVYTRFLLTHLKDPVAAVAALRRAVRPGGVLITEDVDLSGHFCYPHSPSLWRYVELLATSMRARGGDPEIGPRLPLLLRDAGLAGVRLHVVQPAATEGELKLINPVTMENIADTVVADGLASADEVAHLIEDLYAYARDPGTVASLPRVVQAWGTRPTA